LIWNKKVVKFDGVVKVLMREEGTLGFWNTSAGCEGPGKRTTTFSSSLAAKAVETVVHTTHSTKMFLSPSFF